MPGLPPVCPCRVFFSSAMTCRLARPLMNCSSPLIACPRRNARTPSSISRCDAGAATETGDIEPPWHGGRGGWDSLGIRGRSAGVCRVPRSPREGPAMLEALLERFRRGDRRALSRLVSLVARGERVEEVLAGAGAAGRGPARVVAFTGSAGVGKSTLVGKMIEQARGHGRTVAVLACDPQSPLSGGALLGDRFRMPARPDDDGVFIRSLAAAGGHGALAEHLAALVRLLEAFRFDVVLIETVGAGQGDTVVRELVDGLVLLLQREAAHDLPLEQAGLFEVADVIAIHKADLPGAERVEAPVLAALALGTSDGETPVPPIPVLRVSSRSGEGVR